MRALTAMPSVPVTYSATEVAESLRLARRAEGPRSCKAAAGIVPEADTVAPLASMSSVRLCRLTL
jgi:hypothetical protein